jgi:hypothetical protein
LNPNFFAKKCIFNRDAYLNMCVLKREVIVPLLIFTIGCIILIESVIHIEMIKLPILLVDQSSFSLKLTSMVSSLCYEWHRVLSEVPLPCIFIDRTSNYSWRLFVVLDFFLDEISSSSYSQLNVALNNWSCELDFL